MISPSVDVVIPTYNRSSLVVRAVKSVIAQKYRDFHIWIVDDGSTDDTRSAIERLSDSRITYLRHNSRRGGAAARNTAIQESRSGVVAFLDSDDEWSADKLRRQVEYFNRAEVGVVYCGLDVVDDRFGLVESTEYESADTPTYRRLLGGWCPPTTSLFAVRREALMESGVFDVNLGGYQDYDLWLRLARVTKFAAVPGRLVTKHVHGEHQLTSDPESRAEALQLFLGKWSAAMEAVVGPGTSDRVRGLLVAQIWSTAVVAASRRGERLQSVGFYRRYVEEVGIWHGLASPGPLVAATLGHRAYTRLRRLRRRKVGEVFG